MADRLPTAPARTSHVLLSLFLLWHGLAWLGSATKPTPLGPLIRAVTKPYEQLLGVNQNWPMFAPNAPRAREWVEATATRGTERRVQPPLVGELPDERFEWFYRRTCKYERNLPNKDYRFLRRSYAQWVCKQQEAAGWKPRQVLLSLAKRPTPDPDTRRKQPGAEMARVVSPLDEFDCP